MGQLQNQVYLNGIAPEGRMRVSAKGNPHPGPLLFKVREKNPRSFRPVGELELPQDDGVAGLGAPALELFFEAHLL